jgi:hypothetical protein
MAWLAAGKGLIVRRERGRKNPYKRVDLDCSAENSKLIKMLVPRRSIAVIVLVIISLGLTAFWNNFAGIVHDFAGNFTGLASLGCALLIHQFIVRRILHRHRLLSFLIGVALSGILSIVLYDWFRDVTAHITFVQREGTSIKWGDDGMSSGLPRSAFGLGYSSFWTHLPRTLVSSVIYGVVWFPILAFLERWAYAKRTKTLAEQVGADQPLTTP